MMSPSWRISLPGSTAGLLFLAVLCSYIAMAVWYPVAYIWLTYEDLYGEWAQTYFFMLALFLSGAIALRGIRQRLFFALLAIACFYVVMEEISWGQRLFGVQTPELLQRYNLQHETNFHNLLTGPFDTLIKRALEYTLSTAFVLYGLVYPIIIRSWPWLRTLERRWLPAPPLYLWAFFAAAAYLELGNLNFNEAEVAELLIGASMALLCGHYWLLGRHDLDAHTPQSWPPGTSARLALLIAGLFGAAVLLSAVTTQLLYRDAALRKATDVRLLNGYEKFAGRYAGYGRWHEAAALYLKVHQAEPGRTSVMRRLADASRLGGDINSFNHYNQMALDILLAQQAENPNKISTNLALSRTYRQRGLASLGMSHLLRAHELAKQRVVEQPNSANEAYWLGKTYKELGDMANATQQFRRAFKLEPSSTKYRKAMLAMQAYTTQANEPADNE